MKVTMVSGLLATLMLFTMNAGAANTSVYKWVDSSGNVHFGDKPTSREAEEVVVQTDGPATAGNAPGSANQPQSAANSEQCKKAQRQLGEYERAPFLYETDADGKRHIMPEDQRQDLLDSVRAEVKSACGEGG